MKISGINVISLPSHHNSHLSYLTLHLLIVKSTTAQTPTHASYHQETCPSSSQRAAPQAPLGQGIWFKPLSPLCLSAVPWLCSLMEQHSSPLLHRQCQLHPSACQLSPHCPSGMAGPPTIPLQSLTETHICYENSQILFLQYVSVPCWWETERIPSQTSREQGADPGG